MKTITATFEVVTPMFLGGADQSPDGMRAASVKGALRFWWRAWAWSAVRAQQADDISALKALHREEARLFGLAAKDDAAGQPGGGQGVFMMHVRDHTARPTGEPFGKAFDNGILYLLGLGLGSFTGGNHCTRQAIPAHQGNTSSKFEVKLIFKPQTAPADQQGIVSALQLFGLLGALGSRARHGFGSVQLTQLAGQGQAPWQAPQTPQAYKALLLGLLPAGLSEHLPPLSALSRRTRIDLSLAHKDYGRLLADLGREQQAYRSYGNKGQVNGEEAERNFREDHHLLFKATQGEAVNRVPERIVFGLPHNYYFSSVPDRDRKNVDVNYRPEPDSGRHPGHAEKKEGRRASPLLLHIHRLGETCVAVHTLLPAQFLPPGHTGAATVEIKARHATSRIRVAEADVHWDVLHTYLDRYDNRETIHGQK